MAAFNPLDILNRLRAANTRDRNRSNNGRSSSPPLATSPAAAITGAASSMGRTRIGMGSPGIGESKAGANGGRGGGGGDAGNTSASRAAGSPAGSRSLSPDGGSPDHTQYTHSTNNTNKSRMTLLTMNTDREENAPAVRARLEAEISSLHDQLAPLRRENARLKSEKREAEAKLLEERQRAADQARVLRGQLSALTRQYNDLAAGRIAPNGAPLAAAYTNSKPLSDPLLGYRQGPQAMNRYDPPPSSRSGMFRANGNAADAAIAQQQQQQQQDLASQLHLATHGIGGAEAGAGERLGSPSTWGHTTARSRSRSPLHAHHPGRSLAHGSAGTSFNAGADTGTGGARGAGFMGPTFSELMRLRETQHGHDMIIPGQDFRFGSSGPSGHSRKAASAGSGKGGTRAAAGGATHQNSRFRADSTGSARASSSSSSSNGAGFTATTAPALAPQGLSALSNTSTSMRSAVPNAAAAASVVSVNTSTVQTAVLSTPAASLAPSVAAATSLLGINLSSQLSISDLHIPDPFHLPSSAVPEDESSLRSSGKDRDDRHGGSKSHSKDKDISKSKSAKSKVCASS